MPDKPLIDDLTVVVPTLGRPLLEQCLDSIAAGSAWPAKLIVSQQGSRTEPAHWVARLRALGMEVEHLVHDQRGASAARNRALERVGTAFVAGTDDDCRVASDWLATIKQRVSSHDCAVTGQVLATGDGSAPSTRSKEEPAIYDNPDVRADPFFANNYALPTAVFERIGLFDEDPRLRFSEDCEFSHRLLKSGVIVRYEPSVLVWHESWRTDRQLSETYRQYSYCLGAFYGKYLRRRDKTVAKRALIDLLRGPYFLTRGLATRNRDLTLLGVSYTRYLPLGILSGLRALPGRLPAWL